MLKELREELLSYSRADLEDIALNYDIEDTSLSTKELVEAIIEAIIEEEEA